MELINGRIVTRETLDPWHVSSTDILRELLASLYGMKCHVRSPAVLGLGDHSEPEPDILVLRRREDHYRNSHPEPSDAWIMIEVSNTSRVYDLGSKHDLYARHGVPEYWVVDGKHRCVHVFRNPLEGMFRESRIYQAGESIPLPNAEGASLRVDAGWF
ncbi:Uma2 family endonuclease [Prosthecobacter fusiformis]|uniref:Uma2 family endonuclease n=1 Tax=Prosthecobacter fusiformis TaxID=48464 RepID=UPI001FBA310D|nr:Uma2 family endonuclease [Prosthecobacter fusiformis]